jgi:hypothetical protein
LPKRDQTSLLATLVSDRISKPRAQLVKQRPHIGVMGTDQRLAIAILDRPAIFLRQHLDAARCSQQAVQRQSVAVA